MKTTQYNRLHFSSSSPFVIKEETKRVVIPVSENMITTITESVIPAFVNFIKYKLQLFENFYLTLFFL
jgi:hypothetical protein